MSKSPDAFRTISEVADWLGVQAHVLRFWESKFTQVKPVKRAGGRRYYRPADMQLLGGIRKLLHEDGLSIKEVQALLREHGVAYIAEMSHPLDGAADAGGEAAPPADKLGADWQESLELANDETVQDAAFLSAGEDKVVDFPQQDGGQPAAPPAASAPQMQMDLAPPAAEAAPAPAPAEHAPAAPAEDNAPAPAAAPLETDQPEPGNGFTEAGTGTVAPAAAAQSAGIPDAPAEPAGADAGGTVPASMAQPADEEVSASASLPLTEAGSPPPLGVPAATTPPEPSLPESDGVEAAASLEPAAEAAGLPDEGFAAPQESIGDGMEPAAKQVSPPAADNPAAAMEPDTGLADLPAAETGADEPVSDAGAEIAFTEDTPSPAEESVLEAAPEPLPEGSQPEDQPEAFAAGDQPVAPEAEPAADSMPAAEEIAEMAEAGTGNLETADPQDDLLAAGGEPVPDPEEAPAALTAGEPAGAPQAAPEMLIEPGEREDAVFPGQEAPAPAEFEAEPDELPGLGGGDEPAAEAGWETAAAVEQDDSPDMLSGAEHDSPAEPLEQEGPALQSEEDSAEPLPEADFADPEETAPAADEAAELMPVPEDAAEPEDSIAEDALAVAEPVMDDPLDSGAEPEAEMETAEVQDTSAEADMPPEEEALPLVPAPEGLQPEEDEPAAQLDTAETEAEDAPEAAVQDAEADAREEPETAEDAAAVQPGVLAHLAGIRSLPPHSLAAIAACADELRAWAGNR